MVGIPCRKLRICSTVFVVSKPEKEIVLGKTNIIKDCLLLFNIYSRTSMARTPMARLPRLFRTHS